MEERKHPGRFTLQFNMMDPRQRDAADLLRQQGRRKAQFLTDAILSYTEHSVSPKQSICSPGIDMETLRQMVAAILRDSPQLLSENHPASADISELNPPSKEAMASRSTLAAMEHTLAAFRRK